MTELLGVATALVGSVLGGTAAAASRYAVGIVNPLAVTTLRYTIGAVCLLPFAVPAVRKFEDSRQFLAAVGLSIAFYALYPYLFTLSFAYTTAARGALALASMPLLTLGFAILLGQETFSWNRLAGILIAVAGLAYALLPKLGGAASTAWKGDLIMIAAAALQAICNILAALSSSASARFRLPLSASASAPSCSSPFPLRPASFRRCRRWEPRLGLSFSIWAHSDARSSG